jgi:hypothetical protein
MWRVLAGVAAGGGPLCASRFDELQDFILRGVEAFANVAAKPVQHDVCVVSHRAGWARASPTAAAR